MNPNEYAFAQAPLSPLFFGNHGHLSRFDTDEWSTNSNPLWRTGLRGDPELAPPRDGWGVAPWRRIHHRRATRRWLSRLERGPSSGKRLLNHDGEHRSNKYRHSQSLRHRAAKSNSHHSLFPFGRRYLIRIVCRTLRVLYGSIDPGYSPAQHQFLKFVGGLGSVYFPVDG